MPDFNGDGRDDIPWWNREAGTFSNWLAEEDGGFVVNDANALTFVGQGNLYWEMAGTGDFNGDGRDDILWISDAGELSNWLATEHGGFTVNDANAFAQVPAGRNVWGIGDFDGDGHDDLLWSNGYSLSVWNGQVGGGFAANSSPLPPLPQPNPWNLVGVGDFNGDGSDDILWRNVLTGDLSNWLATEGGGFTVNDANAWHNVSTQWLVIGVGDFNGDGYDDILWSNQVNLISNWLGTETGGFIINDVNALAADPAEWWIVGVGDYNGDGHDDLLWRESSGALSNWLGTDSGGWLVNDAAAYAQVEVSWDVSLAGDPWDW